MKAQFDTVHGNFDLPDATQLGDTFAIVGTARVVALEEELIVSVYPGAPKPEPAHKATLAGDVRLA